MANVAPLTKTEVSEDARRTSENTSFKNHNRNISLNMISTYLFSSYLFQFPFLHLAFQAPSHAGALPQTPRSVTWDASKSSTSSTVSSLDSSPKSQSVFAGDFFRNAYNGYTTLIIFVRFHQLCFIQCYSMLSCCLAPCGKVRLFWVGRIFGRGAWTPRCEPSLEARTWNTAAQSENRRKPLKTVENRRKLINLYIYLFTCYSNFMKIHGSIWFYNSM